MSTLQRTLPSLAPLPFQPSIKRQKIIYFPIKSCLPSKTKADQANDSLLLINQYGKYFLKFYQCIPSFLQALNFSKQSFSFVQNSKVSIFNDHSTVIHIKSPSLPLPSFFPRNPPFGHFPATSTARMPSYERHHHQPFYLDRIHTNNSLPMTSAETYVPLIMQSHTSMEVTPPAGAVEETSAHLDACEESKFFEEEIKGNVPTAALFHSLALSPSPSLTPYAENVLKLTGRHEMEDFILKLEEERRREVAALGELHPVSRFPFLGRIQLLIKLRSLRQELTTIIYQQFSQNLGERFDVGSNSFLLREHDMNEFPSEESGYVMEIQLFDSHFSVFVVPMDHSDSENIQYFLELISSREIESPPQAFYSLQTFFALPFGHKDQLKRRSSYALWDGRSRSLWWSHLDWQKPLYCHMLQIWHNEAASRGTKMSARKQNVVASVERKWSLQPSTLRKGCG